MLTAAQKDICSRTMSSTAFLYLVMDAVERRRCLSVVRMADGEKALYNHVRSACTKGCCANDLLLPFGGFTADWLKRYGCEGISKAVLFDRLRSAAEECDWFAPSISGMTLPSFDLYGMWTRKQYVDNFFPNLWTDEQKVALFKAAGRVLFINASRSLADALQQRAKSYYGVEVNYLPLTRWDEAESVMRLANDIKAPLTLFSAGPASKWIGPRINGVTLDIGQAACRWTFVGEFENRKKAAADAGRLEDFMKSPYQF